MVAVRGIRASLCPQGRLSGADGRVKKLCTAHCWGFLSAARSLLMIRVETNGNIPDNEIDCEVVLGRTASKAKTQQPHPC